MTAFGSIPPVGGHQLLIFLVQICALLLFALLLGRLAAALRLPPIVGELLTGIVLGPSLLGVLVPGWSDWLFPPDTEQLHLLDTFGQVGVILLVGVTGLQLDLNLARRRGRTAAMVSLPGFVVPLALGVVAGFLVPGSLLTDGSDRTVFAVFLGVAMCVSAIPVIAKTLMDLKLLHRDVGQLILISGTVDDVLGWLGLSVVATMATTGLSVPGLVRSVVVLVVFTAAAALIGRPLVRVALHAAARSEPTTTTITVAVIVVVSLSAATHALGMEAIFGAFVGGVLIRTAGPEVLTRLAPLRAFVMAVLAPVFFAMAGLRVDLRALADPTVLVAGVVLLLIAVVGKFAGAFIGARCGRLNRWEALALGAGMNARGVVEVVVALVGLRLGVLSPSTYTIIVLIAIATSLMGPPVLRFASARIEVTAEEALRRREYESTLHADAVHRQD